LTERFIGFQLKNLGDVLMTLPALALLKKRRPDSFISMVVRPLTAPLLENHPLVDEVIAHDFRPKKLEYFKTKRLSNFLKEKGAVASFHFDSQRRSGILAILAKTPIRAVGTGVLGVSGLKSPFLYNRKIVLRPKNAPWESLALSHQRLVAAVLGVPPEPEIEFPGINLPAAARAKALDLLGSLKGNGPIVGLALRGRQMEKSWPLDFWAETMVALKKEKNARFYATGEKSDFDLADYLGKIAGQDLGNFCGKTDLLEFVAVAGESDLFLTVDTGSAHLVSLTSTPLVTVFTATNPVQWGALSGKGTKICYNMALARFGLKNGPLTGYPVVRPSDMAKAALAYL
jgi:ADP-heptose:LPS heptosyltransferase